MTNKNVRKVSETFLILDHDDPKARRLACELGLGLGLAIDRSRRQLRLCEGQRDLERRLHTRDQLCRQQRMPTQLEEVILRPDPRQP